MSLVLILSACTGNEGRVEQEEPIETRVEKLICIGNGNTAGVGLSENQIYPTILERSFVENNLNFSKVVNAGIKNETISGVNERIEWMLQQRFTAILLAMGKRDMQQENLNEWKECLHKIRTTNPDALILVGIISDEPYSNVTRFFKTLDEEFDLQILDLQLPKGDGQNDFWQDNDEYLTIIGQKEIALKVFQFFQD